MQNSTDKPPLDAASQEQVRDFIRANSLFLVVKARVIGQGGRGAIYTLANGTAYKLTAEELAHVKPRWSEPTDADNPAR